MAVVDFAIKQEDAMPNTNKFNFLSGLLTSTALTSSLLGNATLQEDMVLPQQAPVFVVEEPIQMEETAEYHDKDGNLVVEYKGEDEDTKFTEKLWINEKDYSLIKKENMQYKNGKPSFSEIFHYDEKGDERKKG